MYDVALISALYGGYDHFKEPPPQNGNVQYVLLTDDPDLRSDVWEVIYWPKPHMKPLLAAKAPKMLPAWYTNARASVWIDMSVQVHSPDFALEAAAYAYDGIATWPHPWNPNLDAEAQESVGQGRYQGQRLLDQVQRFYANGLPQDASVRHTAVVARAHNETTERLGLLWDAEYEWSAADQIGFVWACHKSGVNMYELPMDQAFLMGFRTPPRSDAWLSHHGHIKGYSA